MHRALDMRHTPDILLVKEMCHLETAATPTLSHFCWAALFAPESMGTFDIVTKRDTILKVKKVGPVRGFETADYLFLEQNSKKDSQPGRRARQGHKIMWVIRKTPNKYIGKVEDGLLEVLAK